MKFYGKIGFSITEEVKPGVWKPTIEERVYVGDVTRHNRRWQNSQNLNDDFDISTEISIISDAYASHNVSKMRYVEWMDAKWKITTVDSLKYPRLVLTIGGLWNGQQ